MKKSYKKSYEKSYEKSYKKPYRNKSKARISQCMIVKNEEANIERALSWGKEIVSEQIVVDTGSTDRTVEIARQMGAKVYEFAWIDDFAAAKNYAISKARYEWIAFLDADEYFLPQDAKKLFGSLDMLDVTGTESILTGIVNLDDHGRVMFVGTQQRVFRNLPTLRYVGRIHECLSATDGHRIDTVDMVEELSFYHTGYGDAICSKKAGRNLKIIEEELENQPDNFGLWGYLGQEYAGMEQWEKAVEAFRTCLSLIPEGMRTLYDVHTSTTCLRLLEVVSNIMDKGEEAIMEVYEMAIKSWPEESDYDYCMGRYFVGRMDWPRAEYHLKRALELLEKYSNTNKGMMISGDIQKAYEMLAMCCCNNRHLAECVQLTTVLLRDNPYLMSTAMLMLIAFAKDGEERQSGRAGAEEVAAFLGEKFYDFSSLKDRIFVLRAALSAGYREMVEVMEEKFSPEELQAVNQAFQDSQEASGT